MLYTLRTPKYQHSPNKLQYKNPWVPLLALTALAGTFLGNGSFQLCTSRSHII